MAIQQSEIGGLTATTEGAMATMGRARGEVSGDGSTSPDQRAAVLLTYRVDTNEQGSVTRRQAS